MTSKRAVLTLLRQAAELEHQLMVQYLFAAYSLKTEPEEFAETSDRPACTKRNKAWRDQILEVAREEMGHLITVQQVILSLGERPHFDRDSFPIKPLFYPFDFTLEPLTRHSLAKYLWTEKPRENDKLTRDMLLGEDRADIETDIYEHRPNELGLLYNNLLHKIRELDRRDFRQDVENQTDVGSWPGLGAMAIVKRVDSKVAAFRAIRSVVEQGEGHLYSEEDSHFRRFLRMYREFPVEGENPWKDLATNPNTAKPDKAGHDSDRSKALKAGHITDSTTLRWAKLFNKRYSVLLAELTHALMIPDVWPSKSDSHRRDKFAKIPPSQVPHVWTIDRLKSLPPRQIHALTADQIKALSPRQIKALSLEQIGALKDSQVVELTDWQLEAMSPIQRENLFLKRSGALTPSQLDTLRLVRLNTEHRNELIRWARDEMTLVIAPIAKWLTRLPIGKPGTKKAGATFELEGTGPTMSVDEQAQWCAHQRLIDESRRLIEAFRAGEDEGDLISAIKAIDVRRADYIALQLERIYREDRARVEELAADSP